MNRSSLYTKIKDEAGRRKYAVYIHKIPVSPSDEYIEITFDTRLDILANEIYNDQRLWVIIAAANNLGKGTLTVDSGQILRIPDIEQAEELLQQINRSR